MTGLQIDANADPLPAAQSLVLLRWSIHSVYLVSVLAPHLRQIDIRPGEPAAAVVERALDSDWRPTLAIVHFDTSLPAAFVRPFDDVQRHLRQRGVTVWNGAITDIRKTTVQAHNRRLGLPMTLADRDGPVAERLIVKTNLNSRGWPEWALSMEHRAALGWPAPIESPLHGKDGYLVMPRGEIPAHWWDDEQAIIERFIDNRYGLFYRAYLCGEAVVLCEGTATTQIRRMRDATDRYDFLLSRDLAADATALASLPTPAADVFVAAVIYAETFGLDFGSIDFVIDDRGIPYIVDVNTTPYWGSTPGEGEMLVHLRTGLVG